MELKIAGNAVNSNMLVAQAVELLQKCRADRISIYLNGLWIDKIYRKELMDFLNEGINGQSLYAHKLNFDLESALMAIRNKKIEASLLGQYTSYEQLFIFRSKFQHHSRTISLQHFNRKFKLQRFQTGNLESITQRRRNYNNLQYIPDFQPLGSTAFKFAPRTGQLSAKKSRQLKSGFPIGFLSFKIR